eukprot:GSMAST32.ASY1.ANO1.16.1 assembled CDS
MDLFSFVFQKDTLLIAFVTSLVAWLIVSIMLIFRTPIFYGNKTEDVLLLIAHPDDESMFFSPTLLNLSYQNVNVHVLCLSRGNYDGLGSIRERELVQACALFNIPKSRVSILEHPQLQDGPHSIWPPEVVSKQIENFFFSNIFPKYIITFDNFGVSGHSNHISCSKGASYLLSTQNTRRAKNTKNTKNTKPTVEVWKIQSSLIFRKYVHFHDEF